ncbi:MAG: tripartite tricarboxylate transporter substrate binding protein [Betaproteobacteria bacterium]|nr:tripartite tricarboxylate transporter substrate binding protein [Betaproteobacteria bacterium]
MPCSPGAALRALCIAFCATLAPGGTAAAQAYPSKPIRIVVPFPAGGLVDTVTRHIAARLPDGLGQKGITIVVDNRGGAAGTLGTAIVAAAPPDGYTLLMVLDSHAVNPHIYKNLRFNIFTDFAAVAGVANSPLVVVTHPSLPVKKLQELITLARTKPAALTYASPGAGSSGHLAAEQLKLLARIDMLHVPYKGGAPALADLLGGQVHLSVMAAAVPVPHIRTNKLRALAVTGAQRSGALPGIPTAAEAGFPQLDSGAWVGLLAPAGTPPAIVSRLSAAVAGLLKEPDNRTMLAEQALDVVASTPAEFGALIRAEHDKWGRLIEAAKLKITQ